MTVIAILLLQIVCCKLVLQKETEIETSATKNYRSESLLYAVSEVFLKLANNKLVFNTII